MERLHQIIESIARVGAYIGCVLLVIGAGLVAFEVIARKIFNYSLAGADELAGYALGISMAWGYGYALFRRAHIRVDALYVKLPFKLCCVLDVVSLLGFAVIIGYLDVRVVGTLMETIRLGARAGTPLGTPLWMPQTLWVAGLLFFQVCILLLLVRTGGALFRGDYNQVRKLYGAPSVMGEGPH